MKQPAPAKSDQQPDLPSFPPILCLLSLVLSKIMIAGAFPLIHGVPLYFFYWILTLHLPGWVTAVLVLTAPLTFSAMVVLIAGTLSLPCQPAVVRSKYPHDLRYPLYAMRRLYGIALCSVIYFRPVFHLVLLVRPLKALMFRLFGYRGSLDFTVYPDTWIRDLPLLDFGKGVYVANRVTLGSNIVLRSGEIYVDRIVIGQNTTVGHLTLLGPGCRFGKDTEIGVACDLGMGITIGGRTTVGPTSGIDHGCAIGNDVRIGTRSHIGTNCRIGDGVRLPPGSIVPKRSVITCQQDVEQVLISSNSGDSRPTGPQPVPDAM